MIIEIKSCRTCPALNRKFIDKGLWGCNIREHFYCYGGNVPKNIPSNCPLRQHEVKQEDKLRITREEYKEIWGDVHRYCMCPECKHLVECDHAGIGTCRHCNYIVMPSECDDIDVVATFNNMITDGGDVMRFRVKEGGK